MNTDNQNEKNENLEHGSENKSEKQSKQAETENTFQEENLENKEEDLSGDLNKTNPAEDSSSDELVDGPGNPDLSEKPEQEKTPEGAPLPVDENSVKKASNELDEKNPNKDENDLDLGEGNLAVGPGTDAVKAAAEEEEQEEEKVETTIDQTKRIRLELDKVDQLCKVRTLVPLGETKSVFKSKAWLGKLLAQLEADNPYAGEEKIKTAKDIPATADKAEGNDFAKEKYNFGLLSPIDAVILLRATLGKIIQEIESIDLSKQELEDGRLAAIAKTQSYIHACEARFDLGAVLASLRK